MDAAADGPGRLRLAAELRRLRDLYGVSGRELARRIDISQSKVSRIESGVVMPSLPEVTAWGAALEVPQETRQHLTFLAAIASTEIQPWRDVLRDGGHAQDDVDEVEGRAERVRTYQLSVVPGLLQTAEYARLVLGMFHSSYTESDSGASVAARLHRQRRLFDRSKRFDFLIAEAALRWRPGSIDVMLGQWDRIASISTLTNVSIGLIPLVKEASTLPSHSFVIYDGGEYERGFVTVEMIHATMAVHDSHDVDLYEERWEQFRQMAVFDDDAHEYLTTLTEALRTSVDEPWRDDGL